MSRYYGITIATCIPYDPASKGGVESTVKLAKTDLDHASGGSGDSSSGPTAPRIGQIAFERDLRGAVHSLSRERGSKSDGAHNRHSLPARSTRLGHGKRRSSC